MTETLFNTQRFHSRNERTYDEKTLFEEKTMQKVHFIQLFGSYKECLEEVKN